MTIAIYVIQNRVDDKLYVGQSRSPKVRAANHRWRARNGQAHPLYAAMRRHGEKNFVFSVIEEHGAQDDADEAEEFWMQFFRSRVDGIGYNLRPGGAHGACPESAKAKLRAIHKGRKFSQETLGRMKIAANTPSRKEASRRTFTGNKWNVGRIVSQESRDKVRASLAGRPSANRGRTHTDETRAKVKAARARQVMKRKLPDAKEMDLCGRYLAGACQDDLAVDFGVCINSVFSIIKRHGARRPGTRGIRRLSK